MKKMMIAAVCGTLAGGVITTQVAGPLIAQDATKNASVYEQLDLFGDIFERIRAQYVEEVDSKALIEADQIDCMVALPGQLFYSTQIPACLWFLARDKSANGHRDRRGEILFIDARKLGHLVDRTRREFSDRRHAVWPV